MDEQFVRDRITLLRLRKGVSEYKMSYDLGQNHAANVTCVVGYTKVVHRP